MLWKIIEHLLDQGKRECVRLEKTGYTGSHCRHRPKPAGLGKYVG